MIEAADTFAPEVLFQFFLSLFLGGILGLEREIQNKAAGLRTYALVSFGATLFAILALQVPAQFLGVQGIESDPIRVIQAVALGIGFIGAGAIIHKGTHIEGVTTAAGIWGASAIGIAVGMHFYWTATLATLFVLLVLVGFRIFEKRMLG